MGGTRPDPGLRPSGGPRHARRPDWVRRRLPTVSVVVGLAVLLAATGAPAPVARPPVSPLAQQPTQQPRLAAAVASSTSAILAGQAAGLPSWVSPASPLERAVNRAAVQKLADLRARALLDHNVVALDALTGTPTVRRRQARLADNLARLHPDTWEYQVVSVETAPSTSTTSPFAQPQAQSAHARVVLRYRLRPWTAGMVTRVQQWTLQAGPGGWELTDDGTGPGGLSEADLWDLAVVQVADGATSLVITTAGSAQPGRTSLLPAQLARQVDAAVHRVAQVWTQPWSQQVVLVAPATTAQLARLVAAPPDSGPMQETDWSDIAALTIGPPPGTARPPDADQVLLNPQAWLTLTSLGQQVVLTHEVTHVATRASATRALPGWLTEGFADYVAYQGTQLPATVLAADALAAADTSPWTPFRPPSDAVLDGADGQPELAYQASWLAVHAVASRWGPERLVDWYATAARLPLDRAPEADEAVALATRQVLGVDPGVLPRVWQQELAALVSHPPLVSVGRGR